MYKYHCTASRPPAGEIGNYIDSAADDADAIRQFREIHHLDRWEKAHPDHGPIQVEAKQLTEIPGSPNQMAREAIAAGESPAPLPSMQETIKKALEESPMAVATEEAPEVEVLKNFGLGDRQVDALKAAGLKTFESIVQYGVSGSRFGELSGLNDSDEIPIKNAVKAARNG